MSARLWMPFYVADYLADTQHLNTEEHGAYLLLLFYHWGHGSVPSNPKFICRITRLHPSRFARVWEALKPFFVLQEGGVMTQSRMKFIKKYRCRPTNPEWATIRHSVFERDDFTCQYCGQRGGRLECDHITPVSRGGRDDLANLATSCITCNRSKSAKTLVEWRR
jgi:5-methylcytosine-specific restriction endonuclease McrA